MNDLLKLRQGTSEAVDLRSERLGLFWRALQGLDNLIEFNG